MHTVHTMLWNVSSNTTVARVPCGDISLATLLPHKSEPDVSATALWALSDMPNCNTNAEVTVWLVVQLRQEAKAKYM